MRGRASTLIDAGPGRLLRVGGNPVREARLMEHARRHGYPVPEVYESRDDALVLERIDGPTMLADLRRRPWRAAAHMRTLGGLHDALHAIEHPDGGTLLHLDLHPENVLLSPRGPVVIDWTNAAAGDPWLDPALTWVILATSGGRPLVPFFTRHFERAPLIAALPAACDYRTSDRNVTAAERRQVERLRRRYS